MSRNTPGRPIRNPSVPVNTMHPVMQTGTPLPYNYRLPNYIAMLQISGTSRYPIAVTRIMLAIFSQIPARAICGMVM